MVKCEIGILHGVVVLHVLASHFDQVSVRNFVCVCSMSAQIADVDVEKRGGIRGI